MEFLLKSFILVLIATSAVTISTILYINKNLIYTGSGKYEEIAPFDKNKTQMVLRVFESYKVSNFTWESVLPQIRSFPEITKNKEKVAIIIPYRNRERQLLIFLHHMVPIFRRQKLNYKIFVVEQKEGGPFNRAKLLNTGVAEASKVDNFDCYFLHDVDILLEDDECLYSCAGAEVKHISTLMNKFGYDQRSYPWEVCMNGNAVSVNLPYFGGITRVTKEAMYKINGYSNNYWQWGAEDDDLYVRFFKNGIKPEFNNITTSCKFSMLDHKQETISNSRTVLLTHSYFRTEFDGLNSLNYSVMEYKDEEVFTRIVVNIGAPSLRLSYLQEYQTCNAGDDHLKKVLNSSVVF